MSSTPLEHPQPPTEGKSEPPKLDRRQLRLRDRAFSHLNKAIDEGDTQLSRAWLEEDGDPDLEILRKDPYWEVINNRLGTKDTKQKTAPRMYIYAARLPDRYPPRPWGRPALRQAFWLILTGASAVAAVALAVVLVTAPQAVSSGWLILTGIVASFSAWQLYKARREVRLVGNEGRPRTRCAPTRTRG